jgi:poly(3-hydroxybutyrate) depolymerase
VTRAAIALVAVAIAAAGCGDQARDRPRAEATATQASATEATATPAPPQAPPARAVHFRASDGKPVEAQYTPAGAGDRAPAVVLLHEIRGGPDQWDPLVPYLHAAGFATLAYASRSSPQERDRIRDLLGAVDWLRRRPDIDPRRLALVGASIGASTTVYAMASGTRRTVAAAVALSPPDSADIWRLQDSHRYRPHDLLMISDDRESAAMDGMMDGAIRSKAMRSEHTGHGVVLLGEPRIHAALLKWLETRVG